jgi:2',3'-cyclic-nucleotide 2'-phosphodiesterase (5'-nucleotidase family)
VPSDLTAKGIAAGQTYTPLLALGPAATATATPNISTSAESNLGDLFCQALLAKATGPAVCILNGGAFQADIPLGPVGLAALQQAYPRNDRVVALAVPGELVLRMLQYGVSGWPNGEQFPQVAGLQYGFLAVPDFHLGYSSRVTDAALVSPATGALVQPLRSVPALTLFTSSYLMTNKSG